jgi:hypothetical protein
MERSENYVCRNDFFSRTVKIYWYFLHLQWGKTRSDPGRTYLSFSFRTRQVRPVSTVYRADTLTSTQVLRQRCGA